MALAMVSSAFETPEDLDISTEDDIHQSYLNGLISKEIADMLTELLDNPVELNSASEVELFSLPSLSWEDTERMVETRKRLGGFKRISELIEAVGFDRRMIKQIEPFVKLHAIHEPIGGKLRIELLETENDKKPYSLRAKLVSSLNNRLQTGTTVSKSATQMSDLRLQKLYLLWQPERYSRYIKRIILGNYSVGFGSGLTFNDARRIKPNGIYPDYTISRYRQLGIAAQAEYKGFKPTLFVSYSKHPASLFNNFSDYTPTNSASEVSEVNELYFEQLMGMDMSFRLPLSSELGLTWYSSSTKRKFRFYDSGDSNNSNNSKPTSSGAYGIHVNSQQKLLQLRAEVTETMESKFAWFGEISSYFDNGSLLISFRRYDIDFVNLHSYSYADPDDEPNNSDELGVLFQIKYRLTPKLRLFGSYDQWKHPSSDIAENRGQFLLRYELSKSIEIGVLTKFHDEDILTDRMGRISQLLWVKWPLTRRFILTSAYKYTQINRENGSKSNDYIYFKSEWKGLKWLRFQGYLKVNNFNNLNSDLFTNLNLEEHSTEAYIQIQMWNLQNFDGHLKYSIINFSSKSSAQPNPKRRIAIGVDYRW